MKELRENIKDILEQTTDNKKWALRWIMKYIEQLLLERDKEVREEWQSTHDLLVDCLFDDELRDKIKLIVKQNNHKRCTSSVQDTSSTEQVKVYKENYKRLGEKTITP